jgi:hypothetical protein
LHRAERNIADRLLGLSGGSLPWPWIDPDKALPWVAERLKLTFADSQTAAERFGWTFAPGDKVMQVENDYDKEVYNGDIGFVEDVDADAGDLTTSFDGRSVTYGFGELDMLVPAYAVTIHKSQGSEYPAVVIPVMTQHYAMLQRNLLYTGITRGKRLVVLVGQKRHPQPAFATLQVSPASNITASGTQGEAFSPASFQYQLTATTGSVNYLISGIPTWLNASLTSGTATTTPVTVTFTLINPGSFQPGTYTSTITFANTSNGQGNTTRTATLVVNAGTKDGCKDGGWKNYVSFPGPFKNQGQCVSYFAGQQ